MARFRPVAFFLLGMFAGFGAALMAVAHLDDPGHLLTLIGSANAFLSGALLVTVGLIGGVEVANGQRTRRLRTVMVGVALLAIFLGSAIETRRRARELRSIGDRHERLAMQLLDRQDQILSDPTARRARYREAMAIQKQAHWHRGMSQRYLWAANRPWLPVLASVPCNCQLCAVPGGASGESYSASGKFSDAEASGSP